MSKKRKRSDNSGCLTVIGTVIGVFFLIGLVGEVILSILKGLSYLFSQKWFWLVVIALLSIIIICAFLSRKKEGNSSPDMPQPKQQKQYVSAESVMYSVDCMEGHDFEYWCADLLRDTGYNNVSVTKGSGDQGVDVIAYKNGAKYAIQCKCYSKDLGNKPVQEVLGGMAFYDCQVGVVMTNRYFTSGAIELAHKANVLLWDRSVLMGMIENRNLWNIDDVAEKVASRKIQQTPPKQKRERTTIKSEMFPHNPDSPDIDAAYFKALPHVEYPNDSKSFVKAYCDADCDMAALRVENPDKIITLTSEPFIIVDEAEHFAKVLEKHCCGITHVESNCVVGRFHVCSVAANWDEATNTFTFANWA